jgi:hemerythrin
MRKESTSRAATGAELGALRLELYREAERFVTAARSDRLPEVAAAAGRVTTAARALFEEEEARLRAAGALSLVRHVHEHEKLLSDLVTLAALAARGDAAGVSSLRPDRWIRDWLAAHALTDAELEVPPRRVAAA